MAIMLLLCCAVILSCINANRLSVHTGVLKKGEIVPEGMDTIFVIALVLLSDSFPTLIGGNGYISVYLTGIILGNSQISNKITLVHFFGGITGLAQILIFFLLGLLSFLHRLPGVLLPPNTFPAIFCPTKNAGALTSPNYQIALQKPFRNMLYSGKLHKNFQISYKISADSTIKICKIYFLVIESAHLLCYNPFIHKMEHKNIMVYHFHLARWVFGFHFIT